jgi:S1-C subfamily serine protease
VQRGWLGIAGQTRPLEARSGVELPSAVEVLGVEENSPAAEAGLQTGDLLLALAGQATPRIEVLQRVLRGTPPGQRTEAELLRAGTRKRVAITPSEAK